MLKHLTSATVLRTIPNYLQLRNSNKYALPIKIKETYIFYRLEAIYTKYKSLAEQCCFLDKSFSIAFGQDMVHLKDSTH